MPPVRAGGPYTQPQYPFSTVALHPFPTPSQQPSIFISLPPSFLSTTSSTYAKPTLPYQTSEPVLYRQAPPPTALPHQVPNVTPYIPSDHSVPLSFTPAKTQAFTFNAPRTPFGTLGPLHTGLALVHILVPDFTKVVEYRLYCLDNTSTQVVGGEGIRVVVHLRRF